MLGCLGGGCWLRCTQADSSVQFHASRAIYYSSTIVENQRCQVMDCPCSLLSFARSCTGRNQMFETMKRGSADRLENVVWSCHKGSDVAHHPAIGLVRGR